MPVFLKNGFRVLYIHVPKTGGTSVELFFESNGFHSHFLDRRITQEGSITFMNCAPQHMHRLMLESVFNLKSFNYICMTVRHPLARILSEYKGRVAALGLTLDINSWVEKIFENYSKNPFTEDNHFRPQHEFRVDGCDVFRQENGFNTDWVRHLERQSGFTFPNAQVSRTNQSIGSIDPRKLLLTEKSLGMIRQFYRTDLSLFGYGGLESN